MAREIRSESKLTSAKRAGSLKTFRHGPLSPFLADDAILEVGVGQFPAPVDSQTTIFCAYWLQFIADYRGALQSWFRSLRVGGHLVLVVSHAFLHERRLALPSPWDPDQCRLYTPGSLLDEVEEALTPNSYRIAFLGDDDAGYDYALPRELEASGHGDILLALRKIDPPEWGLHKPAEAKAAQPDYAFQPPRTRIEVVATRPRRRILILKLDHLGDLILGIPALQRARALFADSEITLVVGSWNLAMAQALGVADIVIPFDAFPRNSSEQEVDVAATGALFQRAVPAEYDLAVDLRVDADTRGLLRKARASVRAGIGTRTQFPFLDIFLPVDFTRNEAETAREDLFNHHAFESQGSAARSMYRVRSSADTVERDCAIVWGPYRKLRPGNYFFEPHIELGADTGGGIVTLDIALDTQRVAETTLPSQQPPRLRFTVEKPGTEFEFRIWTVPDLPSVDLSFFGGRLVREGAASVLHQTEYASLLIELIRMRVDDYGMLGDVAAT